MKSPIEKIISGLSTGWNPDERETSILFDHHQKEVHLETTEPFTARRWHEMFSSDPQVRFDQRSDSLKITVPFGYCRKPEMILLPKHRKTDREPVGAV